MRKTTFLVALFIIFLLPVSAKASTLRSANMNSNLTFTGSTANCEVNVIAESPSDSISVELTLWQETNCIGTWKKTGTGFLDYSTQKTVSRGKEYVLKANVTINHIKQPTISVTKICE